MSALDGLLCHSKLTLDRKWSTGGSESSPHLGKGGLPFKSPMFPMSAQPPYKPVERTEHVPHALCPSIKRFLLPT